MAPPIAVLDVDGTLVDTNYHHAIAWYRAFREHGLTLPVWRIHRHIGMGGDQLVAAVAGKRVEDRQGDSIRAAETALYADAMATALTVMGRYDGPAYAEALNIAAAFVIRTETGVLEIVSPAFAAMAAEGE